jgi:alkylation response protein AidB-like acyl-CoA dehydrogenase
VKRLVGIVQTGPRWASHWAPIIGLVRPWKAVSNPGSPRSNAPRRTVLGCGQRLESSDRFVANRPKELVGMASAGTADSGANRTMELQLSPEESEFKRKLVDWLSTVERPDGLRDFGMTPTEADLDSAVAWHKLLYEADYAGLSWPVEHGGQNASVVEQAIFAEETALAGVPRNRGTVGIDLAGPALMRFGNREQKERLLGPTLRGELAWTQLFSEPDAGSDLAGLRTRADAHDDGWVANGQKVWNTGASFADLGLLLARTEPDGPKHRGITMFIVPMDRPGIEVRPLRQMDEESKFSEVFLREVALTPEDVLGRPGEGWTIAGDVLGRERSGIGAHAVTLLRALENLRTEATSRNMTNNPVFRQRWAAAWCRVRLLRVSWLRELTSTSGSDNPLRSVLKLEATQLQQAVAQLAQDVFGVSLVTGDHEENSAARSGSWPQAVLTARGVTIAGGTSEIQRNIISERVLGLPR